MSGRPIIAITAGDPCGVGPEITCKALTLKEIYDKCRPLVIGDASLMTDAAGIAGVSLKINAVRQPQEGKYKQGLIDVLDMCNVNLDLLEFGKVTLMGGRASYEYVAKAVELALSGEIAAITTGPIHKEAINLAGYSYSGHTEILATLTKTKDYCMMLADKNFRVTHVTTHVPLSKVPELVKTERILKVIELTYNALIKMGISSPRIAVAGLNPHAGDGGLFGVEEKEQIAPAVEAANSCGMRVDGPLPPDTIFVRLKGGEYDAVVAMYHDQGHIATKLVGFEYNAATGRWGAMAGVNITLGLPIIRTSVDHGVAFDKAGKGTANPESMIDAVRLASSMAV